MFNIRQTIEIIDKLIELTQHDQINWSSSDPIASMRGPDVRVDVVYAASHIGRKLRVYQEHFKNYYDEERFFWDEQVKVELVDDDGSVLSELPNVQNAYDLLKSIQFQNPSVKNFYNDLLKS